jgi:hypothetical protein
MKVTLPAKTLADALGLAASMVDAKLKKIAALGHARLTADGDTSPSPRTCWTLR